MGIFAGVRNTAASARLVFANPDLRRINLAWAGAMIGEYAFATAIAVWAYGNGGAAAVAAYTVIRLVLIATGLPISSLLLERVAYRRFMMIADLVRVALVASAAMLILAQGPPLAVLIIAIAVSVVGAPVRPAQMALLPALVHTPRELTAANSVGSTLESVAYLVGPAVAGVLLLLTGVPGVLVFYALTFGWSALQLRRLALPNETVFPISATMEPAVEAIVPAGFSVGVRVFVRDSRLLLVGGLACAQTVVSGAALVFLVVVAHELLRLGDPGVGVLGSVLGAGAIFGGLLAISRSARGRVAQDFGAGVLLWCAAPLLMVVWPSPVTAFAAFTLMGVANPLVDVNTLTLVQRIAPPMILARVLVVLETSLMATMALGAVVMPVLLFLIGLRWALLVIGVPMLVVGAVCVPALRRLDRTVAPPADLDLISALPLFSVLPLSAQEALARRLVLITAAAGTLVIKEGEVGDRFYVIKSGRLDAVRGGKVLSTMIAGDCFGEIALLRDVPRTASVVAHDDAVLAALSRTDFLQAIGTHPQAATRAEDLASLRLNRPPTNGSP